MTNLLTGYIFFSPLAKLHEHSGEYVKSNGVLKSAIVLGSMKCITYYNSEVVSSWCNG